MGGHKTRALQGLSAITPKRVGTVTLRELGAYRGACYDSVRSEGFEIVSDACHTTLGQPVDQTPLSPYLRNASIKMMTAMSRNRSISCPALSYWGKSWAKDLFETGPCVPSGASV
jgi:hypothetical protein